VDGVPCTLDNVEAGTGGGFNNDPYSWGGDASGNWSDAYQIIDTTNFGGGGLTSRNIGTPLSSRNASTDGPCKGNPILPATGNKIDPEFDFASYGQMPLSLSRTYNHYWAGVGLFGMHWQSNLDYKLTFGTTVVDTCYPRPGGGACSIGNNTIIYSWRPDGRTIKYIRNATDGIFYEDKPSAISTIVKQADGSYVLRDEDNEVESYSSAGYISSIKDAGGVGWTFTYNGTYPQRVTHTSGRYIEFVWTSGQLTAVRDPAGNYYGYAYTADAFGTGLHRLSATSKPGAPATNITYQYELASDTGALTGKSFNGVRYSTFSYDASGYAISTEHNGLDKYTFYYTPYSDGSLIVNETNPLGKVTTYNFKNGNLQATTGAPSTNCPATSYSAISYDANGYPQIKSDNLNNDTVYTNNANGEVTQKVEAFGTPLARTTQYVWDGTYNRLQSKTLVGIARKSYTYTIDNRIASIAETNLSVNGVANQTRVTTFTYTKYANGMLSSIKIDGPIAGSQDVQITSFDASGNLTSVENGLGYKTTYSGHNGLGQPGRVVGINGDITDYTLDGRGRTIRVRTYPNNVAADTSFTFDAQGLPTTVTTPDGMVTISTYLGASGRLASQSRNPPAGVLARQGSNEERRYFYNNAGDVIRTEDWMNAGQYVERQVCVDNLSFASMSAKYSSAVKNQIRLAGPIEKPSLMNCNGYLDWQEVWVVRPSLERSNFIDYDELSQVIARRGNNGQYIRYGHDLNGNVVSVTDSLGKVTTLTYDALGRVINSVDAKGGTTRYVFDTADHLTKVSDPRGLVTNYAYDGFGQLLNQSSPDSGTTSFQYNAAGQRTLMIRSDGSWLSYAYDGLGRITWYGNSGTNGRSFVYDACANGKGRLCSFSQAPDNTGTNFTYTPSGQLASHLDQVFGVSDLTSYDYDMMGRVAGVSYPSGISVGYGYIGGQLTTMTATVAGVVKTVVSNAVYKPFGVTEGWTYGNGLSRGYGHDQDGRLRGVSTVTANSVLQSLTFGLNANNDITTITNGVDANLTQNFSYDELSRITAQTTTTDTNQSFGYDVNGNRNAHSWGGVTHTASVDPASNRVSEDIAYGYSSVGNRTSAQIGNSTVAYSYDAFNRLKSVNRNVAISYANPNAIQMSFPAGVTSYSYNARDQRIGKSGVLGISRFIYGAQTLMLAENTSGIWSSYLWFGGELVGVVRNNQLYSVHGDQLGRPEVVTDGVQTVVWRASNFAFDRSVTLNTIGGLNLGLPGQYYDAESGLWNNGFRNYDGRVGRYLETDPIGLNGGLNTYAYVGGNPVNLIDPLGLACTTGDKVLDWIQNHVSGTLALNAGTGILGGSFSVVVDKSGISGTLGGGWGVGGGVSLTQDVNLGQSVSGWALSASASGGKGDFGGQITGNLGHDGSLGGSGGIGLGLGAGASVTAGYTKKLIDFKDGGCGCEK
jgi:RHS repeat-associated protein